MRQQTFSFPKSPEQKADERRVHAIKHGYRSGLEEAVAQFLTSRGVPFSYEETTLEFAQPAIRRKYTPDFVMVKLDGDPLIVETKGRWVTEDRKKMRFIKEQYPDLDIRFVFSNAYARISKQSSTTYAQYAEKLGFPWAHRKLPLEWLTECLGVSSGTVHF